ncbi:hypothetical protein Q4557_07290 [Shewanella sp. 5_MG-2023]|uniref:hypothetical protein n=1 Tax=Shewanella sp. 5_MG-2023 TaxID=3062656 RepID=UPI0026E1E341|nr:hypothetical protein [Shewanella sp. 5_MG-2023]MDO6639761.1 hypothetical protein [Shewanella sp. 5_MG-2023]
MDSKGQFFNGFVFHGTAAHSLRVISENYAQAKRRVFTVTGPYGSGKSTIALLLAGLLSDKSSLRKVAKTIVGDTYAKELYKNIKVKKGWLTVKFVSDFSDPLTSLWGAISKECSAHGIAVAASVLDTKDFIRQLKSLKVEVEKQFDGIIILYDEMGKSLDYLNSQNADLQFFQELAENVERLDYQCLFVGFLHQAFAEYARGSNQSSRDSWAKVQGRYTDLLFNVSEDETITLLGSSIVHKDGYEPKVGVVEKVLRALSSSSIAQKDEISIKLAKCLPLHPLSALLLGPISKRRFSQNERSTFSFLSSAEANGFQDFIKGSSTLDTNYRLSNLYDFLNTNLEHLIAASPDSRAWAAAKDAVERAESRNNADSVEIVKIISLLNLFGRRSNIFASTEVIVSAMDESLSTIKIKDYLDELIREKIIIFRKHLNSYAVFEGSDIDLEEELEKFRTQNENSEEWKTRLSDEADQVVAKGHYHKKGVFRWMLKTVCVGEYDHASFSKKNLNSSQFSAFILLLDDDAAKLSADNHNVVFGRSTSIQEQIKSIILDLLGLEHIARTNSTLQHDNIAKRELDAKLSLLRVEFNTLHQKFFEQANWYFKGQRLNVKNFSSVASELADQVFNKSPKLINELINRAKPSGTAIAARNKLLSLMVNEHFEENLGIVGYPPEMAMYKSVLKNSGIHLWTAESGECEFSAPLKSRDENLYHAWAAALELIKANKQRIVTVKEIYELWNSEPYGISLGVVPIWTLALLLSQIDTLAFYDKDVTNKFAFITEPDDEFVNKVSRAPEQVGVRYYEVDGVKASHINSLHRVLSAQSHENGTLAVAQGFVGFVAMLSPFVKSTQTMSSKTKEFRRVALAANDPNKFLLEDLPKLFETDTDEALIEQIKTTISELTLRHNELLNWFISLVSDSFNGLDDELVRVAKLVEDYSADSSLVTFARRVGEWNKAREFDWVSSLISFLSGKAERNWNDLAIEKAKVELAKYVERFNQAAYFADKGVKSSPELENKDHTQQQNKIDEILSGMSIAEQTVVLRKQLDKILGVVNE